MASMKKEFKGKNIDEAIANACKEFNVSQNDLDIEVQTMGSAGIFGLGRKKAVIHATPKHSAFEAESNVAPLAKVRRHHPHKVIEPQASVEAQRSKPLENEKSRRHETRKGTSLQAVAPGRLKGPRGGGSWQNRDEAASFNDTPSLPPAPEVVAEIKELTQTVLRLMGFDVEVTMSVEGHKVAAHILGGNNHDAIVGREGSTLDALQYLLRKIVSQKFPEKITLSLDAGTYRQDRQKELEQLALELAQKVKETGKSQMISALNPAERRMVHVILQDDTAIRSASIGEGLFKKVRIYLPGKGRKKSSRRGDSSGNEE